VPSESQVAALLARCTRVEEIAEVASSHAYLTTDEIRAYLEPVTAAAFAARCRERAREAEAMDLLMIAAELDAIADGVEQAHQDQPAPAQASGQARVELRCDRCGRSTADSDRDMAAPVVYFVRQGLCHPCSRSTASPDSEPSGDTGQAREPDGVSPSSGEPYGPGTVVDVIAEEINETVGMKVSWPRISGIAHRAAARLRREGLLALSGGTGQAPTAEIPCGGGAS
jgi:hypothetical protein